MVEAENMEDPLDCKRNYVSICTTAEAALLIQ